MQLHSRFIKHSKFINQYTRRRKMADSYKKLATLVGCNYFNTRNELRGCINDVKSMQKLLIERYGFKEEDMVVLTDAPDSIVMPTGANIRSTLKQMIERAEPGDMLFFHYSGHGTLIPHHGGRSSKKDEAIVPCDFNLITDVDFRQLVNQLPAGASFTIVSDSCHSGGLIDKEKEQIGPESMNTKKRKSKTGRSREKMIPYHEVLEHVASMSAVESEHIGVHLMNIFGNEASKKFTKKDGEDSGDKNMSEDDGILLSGCQVNETSADMSPEGDDNGGKAYGAFSNAIQSVLNKEKEMISNRELVLRARKLLKEGGFSQHPCLYCSDANADAPFLGRQD